MNLNNPYNPEDFLIFLREFLPNFSKDIRKITLPKANRNILNARLLGTSADLDLSVFEIEHAGSVEKRISLAQDGFRIMKESATYRALAVFYCSESSNWRFSLMTMSPSAKETGRIQVEYSNPRRYSFLLGTDAKIKTPHDYLQKRGVVNDFEDLQLRFSVDVVTKEFFKELSNWYFWAIDNVKFPKDAETEENGRNVAVIRLITRMIFIWFMRERGLVPKRLFEKVSMGIVLKNLDPEDSNYYKAILQNLFFATLSTKQEERQFREEKRYNKGWNKDFGNQYVYRYHDLFTNPEEIKNYFNDIPFLNGGLFECLDDGKGDTYIDGFTERSKEYQPAVPNFLFFSEEKVVDLSAAYGTKGKTYKVRGLLNILSSFNFTIDENSTDDQDIALDPELLGRVFENLLASFNPETSTTARKATGSYYTPREIVDYMVVESLKAYFKTHLSKVKDIDDKLNNLFSAAVEENPFSKSESKKIVALIEGIRIVDPAVGSGAFPMGALNKVVFILNKVDPRNELWKQAQIEATEAIPDPQVRRVTEKQIEEFFKGKNADYGRKLYLIQKCIYGVDIQQIAVEIAKLRFFISLLVDEKIDKASYNWGVQPLPNLDFKIMCGNSLQSVETHDLFGGHKKQELEKLKEKLFFEPNKDKKKKIKIEIDKLFNELTSNRSIFDFALYFSEVFREKGGFDVVIANPPYVSVKEISGKDKRMFFDTFQTGRGRFNLFTLFLEQGYRLLRSNGILTFILPEGLYSNVEYRFIREYLLQNSTILFVNLFSNRVFEAAVDTSVVSLINKKALGSSFPVYRDLKNLSIVLEQNDLKELPFSIFPVNLTLPSKPIIEKFLHGEFKILESILEIQQGIIYSGLPKEKVFSNEKKNQSYKKVLDGRDVLKWKINWEKKAENRFIYYSDKLHRPREERLYLAKEKILIPRKATKILAAYDDKQYYALNTAYLCLLQDEKFYLKYILACINSKLINYFYSLLFFGWQITIPALNIIPIPQINKKEQEPFVDLVDKILAITSKSDYDPKNPPEEQKKLEKQIDQLVYKLYGLTPEEIKIVENTR